MGIASFSCVAEKAEMRCPIYTTQLAGVSLKIEIHISLNRSGGLATAAVVATQRRTMV